MAVPHCVWVCTGGLSRFPGYQVFWASIVQQLLTSVPGLRKGGWWVEGGWAQSHQEVPPVTLCPSGSVHVQSGKYEKHADTRH